VTWGSGFVYALTPVNGYPWVRLVLLLIHVKTTTFIARPAYIVSRNQFSVVVHGLKPTSCVECYGWLAA
jgi:hypothetical protein